MPGGAAVDRRAPARDADRRHRARADARARRSATSCTSRSRGAPGARWSAALGAAYLFRRGRRPSPRDAEPPAADPPARDPQPAARGRARGHGDAQDLLETVRALALPAARPDGGRRAQPPARAVLAPRGVRRGAVRAARVRGAARCSSTGRTRRRYVLSEDLPIHRHAMRAAAGGAWRTRMTAWWEGEARVPRPHPRAADADGPAARARHRGPREGAVGVERLDERAQRRADARPDVGPRRTSASRAARARSASGT